MSNSSLRLVGARAIVEGMPAYKASMDAVNKALDTAGLKSEQAAKRSGAMSKAYDAMGKAASVAERVVSGAATGIAAKVAVMAAAVVGSIGAVISILVIGLAAAIGVAVGAVGALVAGLAALSSRGAGYEGVIDSFERLTASVQLSSTALYEDLRTAAAGTVADLDLLRQANVALAGASGETGKQFGEALPRLLEIARAQARATGQDVTFLFESLVTGIKRTSPMIIDNIGLVLKVGEANAAYAESIGKTVEQLSGAEQQAALLQATLAAGEQVLATYGNAGETLATKLERAKASITNILDYLAIALQPVAKAIMDAINPVLTGIANFVRNAVPYIQALGMLFVNAIKPFLDQIKGVADQLNSPGAARSFFNGAMNTFGAFLRGVVLTGVQIVQAVAAIANAIADLLIGFSPPKKGPLSMIDKGGANVMAAWMDGLVGGFSLEPVEKVAAQVAAALGPVAAMALAQIDARLAQLDSAIKPFQDRLSIVRAEFDAIAKIGELAIKGVQRQLETAVQALIKGGTGSGELVRKLDAQRQAIEDTLSAQQQQTEEYELQLAIAEAMQARERAILNVRKSQIPALAATAAAIGKASQSSGGAADKPPKEETGSGGEPPALPGSGFTGAPVEDLFGIGTNPAKIKQMGLELTDSFNAGFGDAGDLWATATGALTKGGNRLEDAFSGLGPRIQERMNEMTGGFIQGLQKLALAADEHLTQFGIKWDTFWGGLPARVGTAIAPFVESFNEVVNGPFLTAVRDFILFHTDIANPEGIIGFFAAIPANIQAALEGLGEWVNKSLVLPIINQVALIQAGFDIFFNGEGEGSLQWIFAQALKFLTSIPAAVGAALLPVARFMASTFVNPIIGGLNQVMTAFVTLLRNLREPVAQVLDLLGEGIRLGTVAGLLTGGDGGFKNLAAQLRSATFDFTPLAQWTPGASGSEAGGGGGVGEATRFARGGLAGPGLMKVGENGPEYIAAAQRLAVFPNSIVRSLEAIMGNTMRPYYAGMSGIRSGQSQYVHPSLVQNTSNNYDNSRSYGDINVIGARDGQDVASRLAMLRAWR